MHIIMNDKRKYEVSPVLTFIIAYLPEEDLYYIRVIILKHTWHITLHKRNLPQILTESFLSFSMFHFIRIIFVVPVSEVIKCSFHVIIIVVYKFFHWVKSVDVSVSWAWKASAGQIYKKSPVKNSHNSSPTIKFHLSETVWLLCHTSLPSLENLLSATVNTSELGLSEEYHSYSK